MNNNTIELNLSEMEMISGGWDVKRSVFWGVVDGLAGAAAGAFFGVPGAIIGGAVGAGIGVLSGME